MSLYLTPLLRARAPNFALIELSNVVQPLPDLNDFGGNLVVLIRDRMDIKSLDPSSC
jgi:hypothetical protein